MNFEQLGKYINLKKQEIAARAGAQAVASESMAGKHGSAEAQSKDALAEKARELIASQTAMLRALLDAPNDGSVFSAVKYDESNIPGPLGEGRELSRNICVPELGGLVLTSFMPEGDNPLSQDYHLAVMTSHSLPKYARRGELHIAGAYTHVPGVTDNQDYTYEIFARHDRSGGGSRTVNINAHIHPSSPCLYTDFPELEDSVETLGAICEAAGIDVESLSAEATSR